ncbi:hypothetical protein KR222_005769, partial [Zaprionus bogoriensis]
NKMKPDILTVCILATTILASTRHVIGFLTAQTAAASPVGPVSVSQQQQQQDRLVSLVGGDAGVVGDEDVVLQPRRHLDAQERNVYDPGDELLNALNTELDNLLPSPQEPDYGNAVYNELQVANKFEMLKKMEEDLRVEQELVDKSALLMKMLEVSSNFKGYGSPLLPFLSLSKDPTLDTLPLVYVEEDETPAIAAAGSDDYTELENLLQSKPKRSRYYRRYPWKRHNRNRGSYMNSINSNYEPELRYACTPSKEDIFKLLVNLHENRKGNHSKTVNFCNRKRPAKAVFTNIRFLG